MVQYKLAKKYVLSQLLAQSFTVLPFPPPLFPHTSFMPSHRDDSRTMLGFLQGKTACWFQIYFKCKVCLALAPRYTARIHNESVCLQDFTLDIYCIYISPLCVCMCMLSHVWFFMTPWTVARQAHPSMGFSRQEYRNGLPFSSPGMYISSIFTQKILGSHQQITYWVHCTVKSTILLAQDILFFRETPFIL